MRTALSRWFTKWGPQGKRKRLAVENVPEDAADESALQPEDETPPTREARQGEQDWTHYRVERLFSVNGTWYLSTREGIDVGPFDTEREARKHEKRLVMLLKRARTAEEAHRVIYEYNDRPAVSSNRGANITRMRQQLAKIKR